MGTINPITTSFHLPDGREVIIETGKLAAQAHGSAVIRVGKTILLATAVSSYEAKPDAPFFPLFVDYQEKFSAVGRIPGNFFRREGRLTDQEILVCRLCDRAIRPLFPKGYMCETQIFVQLLSADDEEMPDALAALAVSSALSVSDIPWDGPISEVRVAKINGEYVINPSRSALQDATLNVIVAATLKDVTMVEGDANECSEQELIEAIKIGHDAIRVQCNAQLDLAQKVGDKALIKREVEIPQIDGDLFQYVQDFAADKILDIAKANIDKIERKNGLSAIKDELIDTIKTERGEDYITEKKGDIVNYFDDIKKTVIREMMLSTGNRLDGRKNDEIRDIWSEVAYLPGAHGSAIFTRGETQALASLTLGTKLDEQLIDNALDMYNEKFILHYNFPALSVGEVKPMRGPGRREVGHANLASRSLKQVLPKESPYTMRIISDILESNGSSSMATVCASSLALMDAGIHIARPISGIAMGLIADGDRYMILSDILGDEDALGDMDFKVTGTEHGICGCQMDIKIDGLSYAWIEEALEQARKGRLHILGEMNKTISEAAPDLKPHAPRMMTIEVEKEFIGAIIGPGGKIIQELQAQTGTVINIEEANGKGIVTIACSNKESIDTAAARIHQIVFRPTIGDTYDAVVEEILPFGVVVAFQGKSGLLHISQISHSRVENVEEHFSVGDELQVKLVDIDSRTGKFKLSRKALLPNPRGNEGGSDDSRGGQQYRSNSRDRDRRPSRD